MGVWYVNRSLHLTRGPGPSLRRTSKFNLVAVCCSTCEAIRRLASHVARCSRVGGLRGGRLSGYLPCLSVSITQRHLHAAHPCTGSARGMVPGDESGAKSCDLLSRVGQPTVLDLTGEQLPSSRGADEEGGRGNFFSATGSRYSFKGSALRKRD